MVVKKGNVNGVTSSSSHQTEDQARTLETLTIEAPDGSAKACFIRTGATVTNFWVYVFNLYICVTVYAAEAITPMLHHTGKTKKVLSAMSSLAMMIGRCI